MSSRIDAWDQKKHREFSPVSCGYPAGFEEKYDVGDDLGRGGFGVVRVVSKKKNGKQYAAKSIKKVLEVPNLSIDRQAAHLANIKREISVLYRLRGTLNVVHFKEALEDSEYVHIIMEMCRGGELSHSLAQRHYSEKTVSSYMRAVLRTLAQCHSHRILHRDVKPGNFMLLNTSERSPLKAIDFGLAVFYDANKLPRTDLGLEGTPWFLAPENLSSEFYPASDLWSAGVMAYQLLSGYLPFDDRRNRSNPALSQVWKAILTEEPNFNIGAFQKVSEDAKSFISMLLNKDHSLRPSAKDALNHPWLAGGNSADRAKGAPLQQTVVQRIQRFNQGSALKRTIFELIAQELLLTLVPDPSAHGAPLAKMDIDADEKQGLRAGGHKRPLDEKGAHDSTRLAFQGPGGGAIEGPPLLGRVSAGSAHGGLEYYRVRGESVHGAANAMLHDRHGKSLHGGGNYWRILRAAATAAKWHNRSVHGTHDYVRWVGRTDEERAEQRKAARLCLDTSAHAGSEYRRLVHVLSNAALNQQDSASDGTADTSRWMPLQHMRDSLTDVQQDTSAGSQQEQAPVSPSPPPLPCIRETSEPPATKLLSEGEEGRRGQRFYKHFVESTGGRLTQEEQALHAAEQAAESMQDASTGRILPRTAVQEQPESPFLASSRRLAIPATPSTSPLKADGSADGAPRRSSERRKVSFRVESKEASSDAGPDGVSAESPGRAISLQELREVMKQMHYTREAEAVTEAELAQGLASLGFRLEASEARALVEKMDEHRSGAVRKSAFVASQLDWPAIQTDYREQWLAAARKVFEGFDDANGLTIQRLMSVLREKLPAAEVDYAVEDALVDAGYKDEEEIDFEGFIRILRAGSADSLDNLDQYDARLSTHLSPRADSARDDSEHSQS